MIDDILFSWQQPLMFYPNYSQDSQHDRRRCRSHQNSHHNCQHEDIHHYQGISSCARLKDIQEVREAKTTNAIQSKYYKSPYPLPPSRQASMQRSYLFEPMLKDTAHSPHPVLLRSLLVPLLLISSQSLTQRDLLKFPPLFSFVASQSSLHCARLRPKAIWFCMNLAWNCQ